VFDLPLAHPAAFFNRDTEKIMRSHSKMTHDDFLKRGWASCSSIPTRPPKKDSAQTNLLARPAARFLTCWLLAPESKKKGLGGKKAFSSHTERKKMT